MKYTETKFSKEQNQHSRNSIKRTIHNNKMERMNGEIRDREKTMRGLKINETNPSRISIIP